MNISIRIFITLAIAVLFTHCTSSQLELNTQKFSPNDPFAKTMVPSQFFELDPTTNQVIEGEEGTVISIPKGAFLLNGKPYEEKVKLELAEALTLDKMILSNLNTTSNGNPLETGGMLYLKATTEDGEELTIDPENQLYIEIPTEEVKEGMMTYKGERDSDGNMNWVDPQPLEKYLIPVDFSQLDFYPEGFEKAVKKGLPYKKHKTASPQLLDSLYYSFSVSDGSFLTQGFVQTDHNEPMSSPQYDTTEVEAGYEAVDTGITCEIDPAIIKTIRSEKFATTFIATREFETRLQVIFKTCKNEILELYINNLDKNLWEVDEMAAKKLGEHDQAETFKTFAAEKLTTVKDGAKHAQQLKAYYAKALKKNKAELEKAKKKVEKALQQKNKEADKLVKAYKKLLTQRENYRMNKYGFEWQNNGWVNVDRGTVPKVIVPLNILVKNGNEFDRVYTYVIYKTIESVYRLNSKGKTKFHVGRSEEPVTMIIANQEAVAISIGYKGEIPYLATTPFITNQTKEITYNLKLSSKEQLQQTLNSYSHYTKENRIEEELKYLKKLYTEKRRQEKLRNESYFLSQLNRKVFPCCALDGEKLFNANCTSCHKDDDRRLVGPSLVGATERHSMSWLIQWTRNSTTLIDSGDEDANSIFREYGSSVQPDFNLSDQEIIAIYDYIDQKNAQ
tara:strand:- start:5446 stop:7470 length:2025 start_codon:yes stop_codon:yes gene_type:complete